MDSKSEKIALFRYGLIATLVLEKLPRGERTRRAIELARLDYEIPFSNRTTVGVDTLLAWAERYRGIPLTCLVIESRPLAVKPSSSGLHSMRARTSHSTPLLSGAVCARSAHERDKV